MLRRAVNLYADRTIIVGRETLGLLSAKAKKGPDHQSAVVLYSAAHWRVEEVHLKLSSDLGFCNRALHGSSIGRILDQEAAYGKRDPQKVIETTFRGEAN